MSALTLSLHNPRYVNFKIGLNIAHLSGQSSEPHLNTHISNAEFPPKDK